MAVPALAVTHDLTLAFRSLDLATVLDWDLKDAKVLRPKLLASLTGKRTPQDAIEALADQLDLSDAQAGSVYDTIQTMVQRQRKRLDVFDEERALYLYVGPLDRVTRPFCLGLVGKVFKKTAIDKMDNGQLPDVHATGGGWNCRHVFEPVDRTDPTLRRLQKAGKRLPNVQARVKRLGLDRKRMKAAR